VGRTIAFMLQCILQPPAACHLERTSCSHATVRLCCPADQITGCKLSRGQRGKLSSWHALRTLHECFFVLFKQCRRLMNLWMYCQHSKCFWNRFNAARLFLGEPSSDAFLAIATTVECWVGQLAVCAVHASLTACPFTPRLLTASNLVSRTAQRYGCVWTRCPL